MNNFDHRRPVAPPPIIECMTAGLTMEQAEKLIETAAHRGIPYREVLDAITAPPPPDRAVEDIVPWPTPGKDGKTARRERRAAERAARKRRKR